MDRIQLMELVRSYQVGTVDRRVFLVKSAAALGSLAAANTLLAACAAFPNDNPPPVVDEVGDATAPSPSQSLTTGVVTYPGVNNDELMGYLAQQTDAAARPAVIVLQEWWGLNAHIKEVANRFAEAGYVALAPDLYHGVVTRAHSTPFSTIPVPVSMQKRRPMPGIKCWPGLGNIYNFE